MAEPHDSDTASHAPSKPRGFIDAPRHRSNWDTLSIGSFLAAGIISVGTLANNIRDKFYHAFVEGYHESRTPFSDIIEKYTGKQGADHRRAAPVDGLFDRLAVDYNEGHKKPESFLKKRHELSLDFRQEVNDRLLKDFKIPSRGFKGWTEGTWKRWQHLGAGARRDAGLGFAAVSAISVGAIAMLNHSKHTLDRVEDRLDTLDARSR
jgi:hypothetical protein